MTTNPFSGGAYGSGLARNATGTPDALVPQPYVDEVIQELPQYSAVVQLAHTVPMSALTSRQPVLSALPQAYFLNTTGAAGAGDYALVQSTQQQWKNVVLTAEELSAIVPIPKAYLADASIDVWGQVKPRMAEALGKAIDAACFFGTNMPSSWATTSIYDGANAAGNVIPSSAFTVTGDTPTIDYGLGVTKAGLALANQGFDIDGFASAPGLGWALAGLRGSTGLPIYTPAAGEVPASLYGFPLRPVKNASFNALNAALIAGSWDNAVLGLRQDMEWEMFTEGVIQDNTGAIVLNLMQENSVALKVTMRLGFATANPVTALSVARGGGFPFAVIQGAAALT